MRVTLPVLSSAALAASLLCIAPTAFADDDESGWFDGQGAPTSAPPEEDDAAPGVDVEAGPRRERVVVVEQSEQPLRGRMYDRLGRRKKVIPAYGDEPPPPGYREGYKSRKNIWAPGLTLLTAGYLASAVSSAAWIVSDSSCWWTCGPSHDWGWGFVPLAGPYFIAGDSSIDTGWRVAYGVFGVAQDLGLILTVTGAASKKRVFIRSRLPEPPVALQPQFDLSPGMATMKMAF